MAIWDYFTPNVLIVLAGGLFALGYLIIHQMRMRLVILAGTLAYIAYYWTVEDAPLWGAIYASLLMMGANVIGMIKLGLRNATFSLPRGYEDIYPNFAPLAPGDFRGLMALCLRQTFDADTVLTREGSAQSHLYFIVSGIPTVTKLGTSFALAERVFVGEVAYLTGKPAAATTTVNAGAEVLCWDVARLARATQRKPQLKLALDAVISQDLARKVALAVAPAAQQIGREQRAQQAQ